MSASLLDSSDVLKNVYFDYIFPLDSLSGDPDDSVCVGCISRLKDPSGDSDDCLRGYCNFYMHYICVNYLYLDFCTYLGHGPLVYFDIYRPTGHNSSRTGHHHIYSCYGL